MKGPALPARTRVLLGPTGFAFRPFSPQKSYPKFRLGPSGLAIRLFQCLSTKAQPKCRLGPVGLAFRASQMPSPQFSARSCPPRGLRHAALDSDHACRWLMRSCWHKLHDMSCLTSTSWTTLELHRRGWIDTTCCKSSSWSTVLKAADRSSRQECWHLPPVCQWRSQCCGTSDKQTKLLASSAYCREMPGT